ncbi:MAG: hypothetical protein JWL98_333 [Xanthomonadaceae bacterium]|nr:hypothetical protein [Xanthomonadaceae bacterium]
MVMQSLQASHARGVEPARLVEELKRIAVEQLAAVPDGLCRPIEEQLQDKLQLVSSTAQRKDLMTLLALRQRNATHVMRFRELIARSFDDFGGRTLMSRSDVPMGLVSEDELGFHLAGQRLAEAIGRRYQQPLELLDLRFEALSRALGGPASTNPVGAVRLAGAFLRTFHDADMSETLQPMFFRQYEQELTKVLGDLYARLNSQLAASGFHADLRGAGATKQAQQAPIEHEQATHGAGLVTSQPAANAGVDLFRTSAEARVHHQRLRDQLHAWRTGAGDPEGPLTQAQPGESQLPGPGTAGRRQIRPDELLSIAALMQHEGARRFDVALSGDQALHLAIREHLLEGARNLGMDPDQMCLAEHDEDAIDLVGLMFESLLGTHALIGQARKLFAKLVMPYVRVALTDENLFVRADHPARRLLDALTLSCESNDGASPQDRELLQHASAAVSRVVAEYNEDLAIFDLAASELQDLLQQQRRRAEVVERRSAETVHGRERLLQARLQAAAALAQRISARSLSPVVAQFLEEHWQHHYVQVLLRDSQGSERCVQVLALADELVGIDEAAARADGASVAERVLLLHPGLVECLSSSGLDDQVAREWMAALARALAFPDAPREVRALSAMAQLADDGEDTRLLQVVGGHAALDYDPAVAERLAGLGAGSWMRLVDESGEEGSVKIAWISPLTSRLLLVNRRGVRKLVASPQQLAALVKAGKLLDDAADLPFDQAMRQVRQRLSEVAEAA